MICLEWSISDDRSQRIKCVVLKMLYVLKDADLYRFMEVELFKYVFPLISIFLITTPTFADKVPGYAKYCEFIPVSISPDGQFVVAKVDFDEYGNYLEAGDLHLLNVYGRKISTLHGVVGDVFPFEGTNYIALSKDKKFGFYSYGKIENIFGFKEKEMTMIGSSAKRTINPDLYDVSSNDNVVYGSVFMGNENKLLEFNFFEEKIYESEFNLSKINFKYNYIFRPIFLRDKPSVFYLSGLAAVNSKIKLEFSNDDYIGGKNNFEIFLPHSVFNVDTDILGFLRSNKSEDYGVLLKRNVKEGGDYISIIDVKTKSEKYIWRAESGDIQNAIISGDRRKLLGAVYGYGYLNITLFNGADLQKNLRAWADGEGEFTRIDKKLVSKNGDYMVFYVETRSGKSDYILINSENGNFYPLNANCKRTNGLKYNLNLDVSTSYDGVPMPYYFIESAQKLKINKTIIIIHGGPGHRVELNSHGYSYLQALYFASHGWNVILPEYRGNRGYGGSLKEAGMDSLGPKLADDVASVIEDAIHKRSLQGQDFYLLADSLGGVIATELLDRYPFKFKKAMLWGATLGIDETFQFQARNDYMIDSRLQQGPWVRPNWRWRPERSRGAQAPKTPILLVQGDVDDRVPITELEKMEGDLREAGWCVKTKVLKGIGHELDALQQLEGFQTLTRNFMEGLGDEGKAGEKNDPNLPGASYCASALPASLTESDANAPF